MKPAEIVEAFIDRINDHDVEGLCALMTEDHIFIDSCGDLRGGREDMATAWSEYFTMFPDYTIKVERMISKGNEVAVFGRAGGTCVQSGDVTAGSHWEVPAAWQAVVQGNQVAIWQIYTDLEPLRKIQAGKTGKG